MWTFLAQCATSRDLLPWYEKFSVYEDNLADVATFFAEVLRDVFVYATAGERGVVAKDRLGAIRAVAASYSPRACAAGVDLAMTALKRLDCYGNKTSILDGLLMGLLESKQKY